MTPNAHDPPAPQRSSLSWPPPGLETVYGRLWPLIALLAIGDVVLLLPLLVAVGTRQHFASLGPFGQNWWFLIVTTTVGVLIIVGSLERVVRLAWDAGRAARNGHGWLTILHVVSDGTRDTGFLLQGARQFTGLAPKERTPILYLRLAAAALHLSAVLLMPVGFVVGVLLGRWSWAGPPVLWVLAVWIPLLVLLLGSFARLAAFVLGRAVRRPKHLPRVSVMIRSEISSWNEQSRELGGVDGPTPGAAGRGTAFSLSAVALAIAGVIVVGATGLLALAGTIPPILASIAIPSFSTIEARLQQAEVYRPFRLDADPSVTAVVAGEALQSLLHVGQRRELVDYERAPARVYEHRFISDSLREWLTPAWVRETIEDGAQNLSAEDRRLLDSAAAHPGFAEFATIAAAAEADIIGTRYATFPDSVSPVAMRIPRYSALRNGSSILLASASVHLAEGRPARAERAIREVISTGFVLMDDGPTLIDNLFGARLVQNGGRALGYYLRRTGRAGEADQLDAISAHLKRATERLGQRRLGPSVERATRAMPRVVTDTMSPLGLRWEFYSTVSTFASCNNLFTIVFGPGEEYRKWVEEARASLVRRESDAEMFRFLSRGWFGIGGCLPILGGLQLLNAV